MSNVQILIVGEGFVITYTAETRIIQGVESLDHYRAGVNNKVTIITVCKVTISKKRNKGISKFAVCM